MSPADVFLGITTSGRSSNIIEALRACREKGVQSILLTGHDGGEAKLFADFALVLPGEQTSTIQELHLILEHSLCECVENAIFPPG
jgi:D-sedoheptulose 7-phosphate isomerase